MLGARSTLVIAGLAITLGLAIGTLLGMVAGYFRGWIDVVIDFLTTALLDNPHRVGKPLRADLDGIWSARRGTYRVLYRIHQERREVVVLRIDHRRDAYRPLT